MEKFARLFVLCGIIVCGYVDGFGKEVTFTASTAVVKGEGGSATVTLEDDGANTDKNGPKSSTTSQSTSISVSFSSGSDGSFWGLWKKNPNSTWATYSATPNDGYAFLGWYSDVQGETLTKYAQTYTTDFTQSSISPSALYAGFTHVFYFDVEAKLVGITGSEEGAVSASLDADEKPSKGIASLHQSINGTSLLQQNMTYTIYLKAEGNKNAAGKDLVFLGWYQIQGDVSTFLSRKQSCEYTYISNDYYHNNLNETTRKFEARFKDPDNKTIPVVVLNGAEAQEVTLKVDDEQKVIFANIDATLQNINGLYSPTITTVSRVDDNADDVIRFDCSDPDNVKIIAHRAGKATITFHHEETEDFKEGTFTFTINVEKHDAVVRLKDVILLDGQTYQWTDFVEMETASTGAWRLESGNSKVIETMYPGVESTTAHKGATMLTFTQEADYKYKALRPIYRGYSVYAVADDVATFKVGSNTYQNLNEANEAAKNGSSKQIILASDGLLLPGDYTISNGNTLLIPYSEDALSRIDKPQEINPFVPVSVYRTLTMLSGANITVEKGGNICVASQIFSGNVALDATNNKNGNGPGRPTGPCGVIDMSKGGKIILNGNLYCWGFIIGQDITQGNNTKDVGEIIANNGAVVYENFIVGDMKGGGVTAALVRDNKVGTFPFNSYFIQNIEVPLTLNYGAQERCFTSFYLHDKETPIDFTLIGTSDKNPLFILTDKDAVVKKWYDATTDHIVVELQGTSAFGNLQLSFQIKVVINYDVDINSADFVLPIPSGMSIRLNNCNVSLGNKIALLPGAELDIAPNASLVVNTPMYVYDKKEWGAYCNGSYFKTYDNGITAHKKRDGTRWDAANSENAKLVVDGALTINTAGALYGTASGADICGNGGTIYFNSAIPADSKVYQVIGIGAAQTTSEDVQSQFLQWKCYQTPITVTAAKLHNEDGSYTAMIGQKKFYNVHGRWFVEGDQSERDDHTYNFTYIDAVTAAIYGADKTGMVAGWGWSNVQQDAACPDLWNSTQTLHDYPAGSISYLRQNNEWLQLVQTETSNILEGADDHLYAKDGCAIESSGAIDENCLYSVGDAKKALVDGIFVELEPNTDDAAYHDKNNVTNYYIAFDGCVWHAATKIAGKRKAYKVEDDCYIWLDGEWALAYPEKDFFYIPNEQNVKIYYAYENNAWVRAVPSIQLIASDDLETYAFYYLSDAFSAASTKKNPQITILKDINLTSSCTYTGAAAVTLDLNGHIISGNVSQLISVNTTTGGSLTIVDNTAEQLGRISATGNLASGSGNFYAVSVSNGTLILDGGNIYGQNSGSAAVYVVNVEKTGTFEMRSGCITTTDASKVNGILTKTNNTILSGGKISVPTSVVYISNGYSMTEKMSISGGYFKGNKIVNGGVAVPTDKVNITGGYYSTNTNLDACVSAPYRVLDNDDATYKYRVAEAYEITWMNGATELAKDVVEKGIIPQYTGATPTKPATAQYSYVFDGWSESDGGEVLSAIPAATKNVTYYAHFTQTELVVGSPLDIIDWTANTLTLNMNGTTGWPLIIQVGDADAVEYQKTDRKADRTLVLSYSGRADADIVIKVTKKSNGDVYSQHTYSIPQIYDADADLGEVRPDGHSVIFVHKGKLSVTSDATVGAVYVGPSAELEVDANAKLTVDSLMLRTTPWEAAVLTNDGTIQAGKTYYTRIISDNSQYYQFALPLAVEVEKVHLSNYMPMGYGVTWVLEQYSEYYRATEGAGGANEWQVLTDFKTITPSAGYEMFSNTGNFYCEYYFPVALPKSETTTVSVSYTENGAAGPAHAGWNALCSPMLRKANIPIMGDPSEAVKVSLLQVEGFYVQTIPTVIMPAVPFYYQAKEKGTMSFTNYQSNAPRRAWHTSVSTQWLRLTLSDAVGKMLDETNIFTHPEKFSVDYESGYDVAKQSTTGTHAALYSELACGALAFAALPDSAAESRILLTVYAAEAKPYTFHLEDNAYLNRLNNVYLHDTETGAVIDLLTSDYEASLCEGTTRGRFYITCVFKAPNITTDVETTVQDKQTAPVQKVLYNGKVYILRNGVVYDLTGRQCEMK